MPRAKRILRWTSITLLAGAGVAVVGCVRVSDGTWYVREAAVPEGWPTLTPIGEVQVKDYPVYRAAVVRDSDLDGDGTGPMFRTLFGHIKDREIAMTAPVDMGYQAEPDDGTPTMASMAFLYRNPTQGQTGIDGAVVVEDLPGQRFASVGVRGNYTDERFAENLDTLDAWLAENGDTWRPAGPPRYLGYNGPFTLPFMLGVRVAEDCDTDS